LVFVYTFSGWVEAFPTQTEKALEVAKCLLKEIIPRFGIPVNIGLDNGPAFVAEVVQLMAMGLGITWMCTWPTTPIVQEKWSSWIEP
jgi:hypothetical protein